MNALDVSHRFGSEPRHFAFTLGVVGSRSLTTDKRVPLVKKGPAPFAHIRWREFVSNLLHSV